VWSQPWAGRARRSPSAPLRSSSRNIRLIAPRAGYYTAKASRTAVRRVYSARSAAPSYASESDVKPRSTKESIVIVAGRAGVGAAIAQGFTARY